MDTNLPITERVINVLRKNGYDELADELADHVVHLFSQSFESRKNASEQIAVMCHVKALGDLNIESISWGEWVKC